jgi:hypothetical protein
VTVPVGQKVLPFFRAGKEMHRRLNAGQRSASLTG